VGTFTSTGLRFRDEGGREFPERPSPRLTNEWFAFAGTATEWLLAVTEKSLLVRLQDETGRVVSTIRPRQGFVIRLALSPDRTRVAVVFGLEEGSLIGIYDTSSGEERASCTGARDMINALVFSPDGQRLAGTRPRSCPLRFGKTGPGW